MIYIYMAVKSTTLLFYTNSFDFVSGGVGLASLWQMNITNIE